MKAVEAQEKILEQFARVHMIKECIGNCYLKQKKQDKAEEDNQKVLEKTRE